jgi:Flp pilus assembly pilin Flp
MDTSSAASLLSWSSIRTIGGDCDIFGPAIIAMWLSYDNYLIGRVGEKRMKTIRLILANVARLEPGARGQGLAEYALILALIEIVAIAALLFLGGQVKNILSMVGKSL